MDSDSEHNGLAFGMLLARRFDGIPHYHFAPPNGPFWSNAKARQSQKETKNDGRKKREKIEKGKKKRNSEGRKSVA